MENTKITNMKTPNSISIDSASFKAKSLILKSKGIVNIIIIGSTSLKRVFVAGGSILCYECKFFVLEGSSISNSIAERGGAITFLQSSQSKDQ